jgi:inosine/xanthosine triphosphatase
MRIIVGSANAVKVDAVKETAAEYPFLADAEVRGVDVPSGVADQPKSLEETIRGARNRARSAFIGCDLSVGIESGIVPVPYAKTGYMHLTVCVVHDGRDFHLGISTAFECPVEVNDVMLKYGLDMNQAFHRCGYTDDPKLGAGQGAIGVLTKGRVDRKTYTKQAMVMAMIHLETHRRVTV